MGAVATGHCLGSCLWIFEVDESCTLGLASLIVEQFASDYFEACVFEDLGEHLVSEIWGQVAHKDRA